jgi:hypothetical protein
MRVQGELVTRHSTVSCLVIVFIYSANKGADITDIKNEDFIYIY